MSNVKPLPLIDSVVQTREVIVEKISKRYTIRHFSSFRQKFPGREKNELMAEHGFAKVVMNIPSPGYRNLDTKSIVDNILKHHNVKGLKLLLLMLESHTILLTMEQEDQFRYFINKKW